MGTVAITNFTGALEGVAGVDFRLGNAGAWASAPWNQYAGGIFRLPFNANLVDAVRGYTATTGGAPTLTDSWLDKYVAADGDDGMYWQAAATLNTVIRDNTNWSMATWFKATAAALQGLWDLRPSGGGANFYASGFNLRIGASGAGYALQAALFDGSAQNLLLATTGGAVNDGKWHSVLVTYAGASSKLLSLYIDGNQTPVTGTYTSSAWASISYLYGARRIATAAPAYLTGGLDDTIWWDSVVDPATDWKTTRYNATSLRTSAGAVDSAVEGAVWSSLSIDIGAVTSDESYTVYFAPSDSVTVPAVDSGLWQLVGSGYTTSQVLSVLGLAVKTGRYGHTRVVVGASTDAVQQYAAAWAGWSGTYASPLDYGVVRLGAVGAPIQAGRVVTFPNAGAISYPFDIKQGEH